MVLVACLKTWCRCHWRKLWRPIRSGVHHRPSPFRLHRCRSLVRNHAWWFSLSYLFACPVVDLLLLIMYANQCAMQDVHIRDLHPNICQRRFADIHVCRSRHVTPARTSSAVLIPWSPDSQGPQSWESSTGPMQSELASVLHLGQSGARRTMQLLLDHDG
jgi:hypothetical protein